MSKVCVAVLFFSFSNAFLIPTGWQGDHNETSHAGRLVKRVGRDFGTFDAPCAGAEGACNNACYYVKCQAADDPNANRITYIGPKGAGNAVDPTTRKPREDDINRQESGCQAANGGAVCGNYPFSQDWINDQTQATNFDCDEWPPAASQQVAFNDKVHKNSLRCMLQGENRALGSRIGNFINGVGGPYPGRLLAGRMSRDDFFAVTFNTAGADQSKLGYCLGQGGAAGCVTDGFQFGMTAKTVPSGRISAHYNPPTDNHYALQNAGVGDLFQCSVEVTRNGDNDFSNIAVFDSNNLPVTDPTTTACSIIDANGLCEIRGLPQSLIMGKSGTFGTALVFEYSTIGNVNHFLFNTESSGNGRGPATDAGSPLKYCNGILPAVGQEQFECWFPCYQTADGRPA